MIGIPHLKVESDLSFQTFLVISSSVDNFVIYVKRKDIKWKVQRKLDEFLGLFELIEKSHPTVAALKLSKETPETEKKEILSIWLNSLVKDSSIAKGSELNAFFAQRKDELEAELSLDSSRERTLKEFKKKIDLHSFVLLKVIGKGSFGKVMLVRKKDSKKIYAMKVLQKANVIKRNQVEHTRTEQRIGTYIRHPFIVTLRYAFQTKKKLYLVLDYCPGGELFFHLGRAGRFSEARAKFYAAQIVLALEYLHSKDIVYRDLKPENVLLDKDGYIALTDFGLAKEGVGDNVSAHSFCGTPEYLAPEILTRAGHGRAADWWSLGALLYEMLTGMPPFYSRNRDRLFKKILKAELRVPRFFSKHAKSLLGGLLNRDPSDRLGSQADGQEIKDHAFFDGIDWVKMAEKKLPAPFVPTLSDFSDTTNFDAEFTEMPLFSQSSVTSASSLSHSPDSKFNGFTYINPQSAPDSMVAGSAENFETLFEDEGDEESKKLTIIREGSAGSVEDDLKQLGKLPTIVLPLQTSTTTPATTATTATTTTTATTATTATATPSVTPATTSTVTTTPSKGLLGALLNGRLTASSNSASSSTVSTSTATTSTTSQSSYVSLMGAGAMTGKTPGFSLSAALGSGSFDDDESGKKKPITQVEFVAKS